MNRVPMLLVLTALAAVPAKAELKVGNAAPVFTATAVRAGNEVPFALGDALKRGPVILYFYPQGPSETCYVENYEFSFSAPKLEREGITVIGVSSATLDEAAQTSRLECSDRLILGSDPSMQLIKTYAAENTTRPGYALSVGYVIAPSGKIIYASRNDAKTAVEHVQLMIDAAETYVATTRP